MSEKENIKMAVFKNFKDDELIVSCKCGCDEGIHFKIHDYEDGIILSYHIQMVIFTLNKDHSLKS